MKNTTMMRVALPWRNEKMSFKLIPIDLNAPFLEARFNYDEKALNIMSKEKYQMYNLFPKLDDNGEICYKAGKVVPGQKPVMKQERKVSDSFYDYIITERKDIERMVDFLTGEANNLEEYFKVVEPLEEEKLAATNAKNQEKKLEVVKDGK